jgi:hypothetical protein
MPPETAAKFGPLIDLIKGSESMNDEERQYWINILPVMTPDQVKNLQDILDNEKKQLAAIDEKYAKEMQKIEQSETARASEEERRKKRENRQSAEQTNKTTEEVEAENLLKKIEGAA